MGNTTDYRCYWGKVLDALALVYAYKKAGTDDFEFEILDEDFPDAIKRVCTAYRACGLRRITPCEMVGNEIDLFFHELVMNPKLLKKTYRRALEYFNIAAPAIPLRTLTAEIKREIKK